MCFANKRVAIILCAFQPLTRPHKRARWLDSPKFLALPRIKNVIASITNPRQVDNRDSCGRSQCQTDASSEVLHVSNAERRVRNQYAPSVCVLLICCILCLNIFSILRGTRYQLEVSCHHYATRETRKEHKMGEVVCIVLLS